METNCVIIIALLVGGGCICSVCDNYIYNCSKPINNIIPTREHILITREHYENLKKKSIEKLPNYTELPDNVNPPVYTE